jgi:hypothetical protein
VASGNPNSNKATEVLALARGATGE